jgi:Rrf2 family transcriptional regulator, nitric oxide-sensitive transcriptional repressor
MLTQTVEYALRAMTYLASEEGNSKTTEEVSERTKVPLAYLAKILQSLAKRGLLRTQRGVGGGVVLAKSATEITILDVVNVMEPLKRIKTCPLGIGSHGSVLCPLHSRLDAAVAKMEQTFTDITLADLLNDPSPSVPLCEVAPAKRLTLGVKGKK